MAADGSARARFAEFRLELAALEPAWANWGKFEAWIAGFRPFVRRYFADYMADFNEAGRKPAWLSLPRTMERWAAHRADQAFHQELATNNRLVEQTKSKLLSFMDGLAQLLPESTEGPRRQRLASDAKRVFVIHGSDASAYAELVKFLRSLSLEPKGLFDVGAESGPNPNILRIVRHGMRQASGVVVFFTPDDWPVLTPTADSLPSSLEEASDWQTRINAIFGAGLALGVAAKRTVVVGLGSDVGMLGEFRGIHSVSLDNGPESRNLLRQKLKAIGCAPDPNTADHLDVAQAGNFSAWLRPAKGAEAVTTSEGAAS